MTNTVKGYIPLVLILLAVIGGIIWIFIESAPITDLENKKVAIGTIVRHEQGQKSSGLDAVISYNYKDNVFEERIGSSKYEANVIGEKYKVLFDSINPNKAIILDYQPIFEKSERTKVTIGKITRLYRFSWTDGKYIPNYAIEFSYYVDSTELTKSQSLPKDFKAEYPDLKEGVEYEVEYWIKNPKRAIMKLKK